MFFVGAIGPRKVKKKIGVFFGRTNFLVQPKRLYLQKKKGKYFRNDYDKYLKDAIAASMQENIFI